MASVELKSVHKSFGSVEVLHDIDLSLEKGEFIVFVGPSGCGKSTLLRLIAGLEDITGGDLFIDGARVNSVLPTKRRISMVFQSYALYPHMNVYDNMAFGLEQARLPKEAIDRRVRETAAMLQIEDYLERKPKQLSGGQRQRVDTRIEIARLHKRLAGTTMIYVTHDQVEAMTLADRIVVLNAGRVEQVGTPLDLYERPASRFVAGFIGSPRMNFIEGGEAAAAGVHALGVRPEHLDIAYDRGHWEGTVALVEKLGSDTFVHVATETAGMVNARAVGHRRFEAGDTVFLTPRAGAVHFFDADGKPVIRSDNREVVA